MKKKNDITKNIIVWLLIIGSLVFAFNGFDLDKSKKEMPYSSFVELVKSGDIKDVIINGRIITGTNLNNNKFTTYSPWNSPVLLKDLLNKNIKVTAKAPEKPSILLSMFMSLLPILLLIALYLFFMKKMSGNKGGMSPFSIGKSKAKLMGENEIKTTFKDVAGIEEAKQDVGEIVDFLSNPKKYLDLGARIPTGVLMVGPPGTGKTLLARAIAGEAKVPFFAAAGSDFVEMFVGAGAARVRDMFSEAKKKAPCLIFIDEIDAVGRQRGGVSSGGNDEREQTLNQLLVEMDGFAGNEGIIVIAATNRPDVLDKALLRPGRFDRRVTVDLPTVKGREEILKVYLDKVKVGVNVMPNWIARGTPGFSGAELANLINEATLLAARYDKKEISMHDIEHAKDKIMMGAERKSMAMSEENKKLTAYHEAGHAIVGRLVAIHDPVYKISIMPRGGALGMTMYLPDGDQVSQSKLELECRLSSIFGGRIAEELIYGNDYITTGASNDIQVATDIATKMVTRWGLSDEIGPILYAEDGSNPFSSCGGGNHKTFSEKTSVKIDNEIKKLIDKNYNIAYDILKNNIDILHSMADALIKYETIDVAQVDDLMNRITVRDPGDWMVSYRNESDLNSIKNESENKV